MSNKRVLITSSNLNPAAVEVLKQRGYVTTFVPPYTAQEDLVKLVKETDPVGILVRLGRIGEDVIDACSSLKVLSKFGVGVDNIDIEAATRRNIPVLNAVGANAKSVAEHAITLMMTTIKKSLQLDSSLREGKWIKPHHLSTEVSGKSLGIVGLGQIGRCVVKMAKGLELTVHAYDPYVEDSVFENHGVIREQSLKELFSTADIISMHCPLTEETAQMINDTSIGWMRPGVVVINTARGGVVDEVALEEALRSGKVASAGLDVFAVEPPPADHPFWSMENVVVSPHVGTSTAEADVRVSVAAVMGIIQVVENEEVDPLRIVNLEGLAERSCQVR